MKKVISLLLAGAIGFSVMLPVMAEAEESRKIYVSMEKGRSGNDGTSMTSAVSTIEEAQALAREAKKSESRKIEIVLDGGVYTFDSPLTLTEEDSGVSADLPIVYRAYQGQEVKFTRGKKIEGLTKVTESDPNYSQLSDAAKENVYVVDLSDKGFATGDITGGNGSSIYEILYQGDEMMDIAQFPNDKYDRYDMTELAAGTVDDNVVFNYPDGKSLWANETAAYSENSVSGGFSLKKISMSSGSMTVSNNGNANFRFLNLLSELDIAGEYYIDGTNQRLYYYPKYSIETAPIYLAANGRSWGDYYTRTEEFSIVYLNGVSNVAFEGIDVIGTGGRGFDIRGCENISLYDVTVTATGWEAVYVGQTSGFELVNSTVTDVQTGGIKIENCGTKYTLTSADNVIRNTKISRTGMLHTTGTSWVSSRGLIISGGVGTTVENCEISDMPAVALSFSGNNHSIKNNVIRNTCLENGEDTGMIYAMRSYLSRGNEIKNNLIYWTKDIKDYTEITSDSAYNRGTDNAVNGIYMDDLMSGVTITGNVIYNVERGFCFGSGRDNTVTGNYVIGCQRGFYYDDVDWRDKTLNPNDTAGNNMYTTELKAFYDKYIEENSEVKALWDKTYGEAFQTMMSECDTFMKALDAALTADPTLGSQSEEYYVISRPFTNIGSTTVSGNYYIGDFAQAWTGAVTPTVALQRDYNYVASAYSFADTASNMKTGTVQAMSTATVTENADSTVTITIDNVDTSGTGVGEETIYQPSVNVNEVAEDSKNRFTAFVAIYDAAGKLIAVEMKEDAFFYNGQTVTVSGIEVPDTAATGKLMIWDKSTMRPILSEVYQLNTEGN